MPNLNKRAQNPPHAARNIKTVARVIRQVPEDGRRTAFKEQKEKKIEIWAEQ